MSNTIKLKDLSKTLKEVISLNYPIKLKYNGSLIPEFNVLRFCIPTIDNLKKIDIKLIELKINGEYYEVKK